MARGRMLNKSVSGSVKFHNLSDDTCRLLATWIIAQLDVQGVFYGDPAMVKSIVFPRRSDVTVEQIDAYLDEMYDNRLLVRYEAKGDVWQYWPGFLGEQIGMRAEREKPEFPPPSAELAANPWQSGGKLPDDCRQDDGKLPAEVKGSEKKRTEGEGAAPPPPRANAITVYEEVVSGTLTQTIVDVIQAEVDECERHRLKLTDSSPGSDIDGDAWVAQALIEAHGAGKPYWNYAKTITKRWRDEGYKSKFVYHGPGERIVPKHTEVFQ